MALLSHQAPRLSGTAITYSAAAAGGDTLPVATNGVLRVKNGSASAVTVTVAVPGNTDFGQAQPDVAVAVAAGAEVAIGPLSGLLAVDGVISVTYSSATSVTVAYS